MFRTNPGIAIVIGLFVAAYGAYNLATGLVYLRTARSQGGWVEANGRVQEVTSFEIPSIDPPTRTWTAVIALDAEGETVTVEHTAARVSMMAVDRDLEARSVSTPPATSRASESISHTVESVGSSHATEIQTIHDRGRGTVSDADVAQEYEARVRRTEERLGTTFAAGTEIAMIYPAGNPRAAILSRDREEAGSTGGFHLGLGSLMGLVGGFVAVGGVVGRIRGRPAPVA